MLTKDGHLIVRHEPNLSNTTNANVVFPELIKTYTIDFVNSTGVHAIDLTVDQVPYAVCMGVWWHATRCLQVALADICVGSRLGVYTVNIVVC